MQNRRKALYNREDARRFAHTMVEIRQEHGEAIPNISTRRMQALPANVLGLFLARPASQRTVELAEVKNNVVVLRYAAGR